MAQRSKAVSIAVRMMYAMIASKAASRAVTKAEYGDFNAADLAAVHAETWLDKAGARATNWHFKIRS